MDADFEHRADLARTPVPQLGRLVATGESLMPYELVDPDGVAVEAVSTFFAELQAAGRADATLRSYGMDLLRWFRFLWALGVPWDRATRDEARDFSRSLQVVGKPLRPHWRRRDEVSRPPQLRTHPYAASVRAHSETVLRTFYEFYLETGTGPIMNPFPLDRSRRAGRANAHHNPMEPFETGRVGRYRPKVPARVPRAIPDEVFNEIFARLCSNRDRALVAFYVSTGARASELLSLTQGGSTPAAS